MKSAILAIFILILITQSGCSHEGIDDKTKRNDRWAWWVDAKTNKGRWMRLSNHPTWKNGNYTKFYRSGVVFRKGTIRDGKEADTSWFFDPKGNLYAYRHFKMDTSDLYFLENGYVKVYWADGKVNAEGVIENHSNDGKWRIYFDNGNTDQFFDFKNVTGWRLEYYSNGQLKDSAYIAGENGLMTRKWYENGQLEQSIGLKDFHYDGLSNKYYPNGKLQQTVGYVNGKPDGLCRYWDSSGNILKIYTFKMGHMTGLQTEYYKNGHIYATGYMTDSLLDGTAKAYDSNGKLIAEGVYKNGARIKWSSKTIGIENTYKK